MKRTKRQENAIVINFTLFLLLTLGVSYFALTYLYPTIMQIETTKAKVKDTYTSIKTEEKTGLSFSDFKSVKNSVFSSVENQDTSFTYKKSLTESLDEDFYKQKFSNTTGKTFEQYMVDLKESVEKQGKNDNKKTKINFILPSYVEDIADLETSLSGDTDSQGIHYLSDFRFINYIETIIDQFNLQYDNAIGINDITLVGDYAVSETGTTLDKNIYYIPVELDLTGQKRFVLLFLYYLEFVGNISIDEENEEIIILNPDMIFEEDMEVEIDDQGEPIIKETSEEKTISDIYKSSMFEAIKSRRINDFKEKLGKTEEGVDEAKKPKYNIFNNQIIDIESITFSEYIDANPSYGALNEGNKNNLLVNITPQMRDEFSFKVKLRFYVKGLPKYKIEELIEQTKRFHTELTTEVTKLLGDPATVDYQKEQLLTINQTLKTLGEQLQPKGNKAETLTEKYNNSYQIKKLLKELEKQLERITN